MMNGHHQSDFSFTLTLPAQRAPASRSCPQLELPKPLREHCWRVVTFSKQESAASTTSPLPCPKWAPLGASNAVPHCRLSHTTWALLRVQSWSHTVCHVSPWRTSTLPEQSSLLLTSRTSKLPVKEKQLDGKWERNVCFYGIYVCDSLTCADNTSNRSRVAGFVCEGSMCALSQRWLYSTAFNLIVPGVPVAQTVFILGGDLMGSSTVELSACHRCIVYIPGFTAQCAPLVLVKELHSSLTSMCPTGQLDVACKRSSTCECVHADKGAL